MSYSKLLQFPALQDRSIIVLLSYNGLKCGVTANFILFLIKIFFCKEKEICDQLNMDFIYGDGTRASSEKCHQNFTKLVFHYEVHIPKEITSFHLKRWRTKRESLPIAFHVFLERETLKKLNFISFSSFERYQFQKLLCRDISCIYEPHLFFNFQIV